MRLLPLLLLLTLLPGCATSPVSSAYGPPAEFDTVTEGVYRSAQPSPRQWQWLVDQKKINVSIKLNSQEEGSDSPGSTLGVKVLTFEIPGTDQLLCGSCCTRTLTAALAAVKAERAKGSIILIHCEHGEDRTGAECDMWEQSQGASTVTATLHLREHNFHPALAGLAEAVEDYKP